MTLRSLAMTSDQVESSGVRGRRDQEEAQKGSSKGQSGTFIGGSHGMSTGFSAMQSSVRG